MLKAIKLLTIVSLLGLISCGEKSDEQSKEKNITSSFLQSSTGTYVATSALTTCPGLNGVEGDSCNESFSIEANGKFSRVYFRQVGINGSQSLPLGTVCKWTESGTVYNILELDAKKKNLPSEITHTIYAMVDEVLEEKGNPVACRNFFNRSFSPLSTKMYTAITSQGIAFFTFGENTANSGDQSAQSQQNLFVKRTNLNPNFTF